MLAALGSLAGRAGAHQPSVSWLEVSRSGGRLEVRWTLPLLELEDWLGLDTDRDGAITWGELESASGLLEALPRETLQLRSGSGLVDLRLERLMVDDLAEGAAAVLCLVGTEGPGSPSGSDVELELAPGGALGPLHRAFVRLGEGKAGTRPVAVLSRDRPSWAGPVRPADW